MGDLKGHFLYNLLPTAGLGAIRDYFDFVPAPRICKPFVQTGPISVGQRICQGNPLPVIRKPLPL